jgi:hypothetical protein
MIVERGQEIASIGGLSSAGAHVSNVNALETSAALRFREMKKRRAHDDDDGKRHCENQVRMNSDQTPPVLAMLTQTFFLFFFLPKRDL